MTQQPPVKPYDYELEDRLGSIRVSAGDANERVSLLDIRVARLERDRVPRWKAWLDTSIGLALLVLIAWTVLR